MPYPEYPLITPEHSLFSQKLEVRLLARTLSPLPIENFSPTDWADLNAAAIIAGEAAKTCYSSKLLTPLDYVIGSDKHRRSVHEVSASTRASGHHSTREHVHYVFGVKNISRKTIYRLHSQPNHATDQESQRYVTMAAEGLVLPRVFDNQPANQLIEDATAELFNGYEQLSALLYPVVRELYLGRFPGKRDSKWSKLVNLEAKKRAQEIGRYLLPLSMGANLYHSINELTLIRMAKIFSDDILDPEMSSLIKAMVDSVAVYDPTIREEIGKSIQTSKSPQLFDPYSAADEFDANLNGLPIRLDADLGDLDHRLADAIRLTIGASQTALSDEMAIAMVLDPSQNPLLASVNGEMVIDQLSRALNQINFSGSVSLSHVIDSQLQRHRTINHTQPLQLPIPRLDKDIVIPGLVTSIPEARTLYLDIQAKNIAYMERLAEMRNVDGDTLTYLHTNATRIRKRINAPLGALHHFLRLRTCLNAQEENYRLAVALTKQLSTVSPLIATHFDKPAPCGIRVRAKVSPICPEGDHYCGIPVWKRTIDDYPKRDI